MSELFPACSHITKVRHIFITFGHGLWTCDVALVTQILLALVHLLLLLPVAYTLLVIYTLTLFPPGVEGMVNHGYSRGVCTHLRM
jgi:hypothetical protein